MYMFLPFLIALVGALSTLFGQRRAALGCWLLLVVVTIVWYQHHATDTLNLIF